MLGNDQRYLSEIASALEKADRTDFSVAFVQRHLHLGFGFAVRLVERLEADGYIERSGDDLPRVYVLKD